MNSLETIHFIQESYRKLLNTMARPGVIEKLEDNFSKECNWIDFLFGTYSIMKMLLDTETSFNIFSLEENKNENIINGLTGAKIKDTNESDFIFVSLDKRENIKEAIKNANIGDLINPEKGATIFIEVKDINKGIKVKLKGPGILGEKNIFLPLESSLIHMRNEKVSEYPTGIDLVFIDKEGNILSIPRTTKILEVCI
ncbi:phosphonate C-P lyase system protein PhnH [Clostridium thermobutyricum]|uniref:Phosphonate C-P lyase system protein PhnH n=1 Tax=Clostridium thermobutyricum TaxID=29372 RepID=N9WAL0_9CLOT|nr:phosphonate C-P lyase system protein PhnH [Clostridium thermobutyricum]ENY99939.1 phosphonate C-P lyase system protein PhnH [Clostridium thermobutyricum]